MKISLWFSVLLLLPSVNLTHADSATWQTSPILGNYQDTSLPLSTDTTVTPDAAPAGTTSINVSTSTDFKGTLAGDRATGVVRVTDAHPAGTYTVTVTAFDSDGATTSKTFALTVTTPVTCLPVGFANAINYSGGDYPGSVALGDFNGDGAQDLAVADYESDVVAVFFGDGAGNFSNNPKLFRAGDNAASLAVGDFNGDGKQDLAVANRNSDTVSILLGNGRGRFTVPTPFDTGVAPSSVAVGDFNGDGKQDLAVVSNSAPGSVSILLGNGKGKFSSAGVFSAGNNTLGVAVGDFNSDGNQDLAITSLSPNGVSILLGNGTGRFSAPTTIPAGDFPRSVAVGDFNGDGKQDLATSNYTVPGIVSILLGDGAGNFSPPTDFTVGDQANSVAVGDFNGDGKQDLAATSNSSVVSILLGDGTGNFSAAADFPVGHQPQSVAVGDFNGDGQQDLAVPNGASRDVSILIRGCPTGQTAPAGDGASNAPSSITDNLVPTVIATLPSSKIAGDLAFTLVVAGTNFVSTSVVQWNGSARPTTFFSSATLTAAITAADIANAGTASVAVTNPPPGGGTSNSVKFTINNPAPAETSLIPSSETAGDSAFTLTVTGTNFVSTSVVQWNGSARPTTLVSSTTLTAAISAADIANGGVVPVTVMNPVPGGGTSNSLNFTINNPVPTATSLSPNSATAGGPQFTLTINGTNFVQASVVKWKGMFLTTTFVDSTRITAIVPAADIATAGTAAVTVSNPAPGGGTSGSLTFTINNPVPTATTLTPSSTLAGGSAFTLKVTGTNFVATSKVQWNGHNRTTTFVDSTTLNASILDTDIASAGTPTVTVFNPTPGGGTSNGLTFTINNPVPHIANLSPDNATAGGPSFTLTVNGTSFVKTSAVNWNGTALNNPHFVSSTQLTVTVPAANIANAGTASVSVTNPAPGGGTSNAATFAIN